MTKKAYIVANEQQEREVLYGLEQEGLTWWGGDKLTKWSPSRILCVEFPCILLAQETFVTWSRIDEVRDLEKYEIVYDGRKEEKMADKYVVSHEFMNELEQWKQSYFNDDLMFVDGDTLDYLPIVVNAWWGGEVSDEENNNRLIAIIHWVNGEDVFEVEKPKKWVVRSKETDDDNDHWYVRLPNNIDGINDVVYYMSSATLFDTKEEAQEWANSHQEVIEVED